MDFKYKFSVITTTYNRAEKIHRVYDSIVSQTLQKIDEKILFEWIIVDDGSEDETDKIVKKWQKESNFDINYVYQENQGKIVALRKGIDLSQGEYILICDSDDAFKSNTFEVFYNILEEKKEITRGYFSIACLCENQDGEKIGTDFPISDKFVLDKEVYFKWNFSLIGERWGIIPAFYLKKFFVVPEEIKMIKFIPESYFWGKMVFKTIKQKSQTYYINDRLRIYYMEKSLQNISTNARTKYAKGFEYESLYFINNYVLLQLRRSPKFFFKHLLKYIWTTSFNKKSIILSIRQIDNIYVKILYILFLPFLPLKKMYFKKDNSNG